MAVRSFTTFIPMDQNGMNLPGALGVRWTGLLNGDTGAPYPCPHRADKAVQVYGTFGAAGNCRIEGSNDQGYDANGTALSPTYATLNDPQANALDVTGAKIEEVLENPNLVRPNITGGDGTTNLTVVMIISSTARL